MLCVRELGVHIPVRGRVQEMQSTILPSVLLWGAVAGSEESMETETGTREQQGANQKKPPGPDRQSHPRMKAERLQNEQRAPT